MAIEKIKQGKGVEILGMGEYTILNPVLKQTLNEKVTFDQDLESFGYLERGSEGMSSHRKFPEVGLELGQSD